MAPGGRGSLACSVEALAGLCSVVGGVELTSSRGTGTGEGGRGETTAGSRWRQRFLFLWLATDRPLPRAHLVLGFLGRTRAALSPGLGRLPHPAEFFSSPGQLPAAAKAAPSRLGLGWWNPAGTDTAWGRALTAVMGVYCRRPGDLEQGQPHMQLSDSPRK